MKIFVTWMLGWIFGGIFAYLGIHYYSNPELKIKFPTQGVYFYCWNQGEFRWEACENKDGKLTLYNDQLARIIRADVHCEIK